MKPTPDPAEAESTAEGGSRRDPQSSSRPCLTAGGGEAKAGAGGLCVPPRRWWGPAVDAAWISLLLRVLVGGAFVFAAVLKIADPGKFALDVAHYRVVPEEWTRWVAVMLPWIEGVAGLCVLAGMWLRAATLLITGLTSVFLVLIGSALVRGLNIECGCFGTVGGRHVGLVNLVIDASLLLLALALLRRSRDRP